MFFFLDTGDLYKTYLLFILATNDIIEEATYSGIIDPSNEWHTLNHRGPKARLTYRVRVKCDSHYYNATCTKFCRPRDDKFGHYICDSNGDKECIEGWKGATCDFGKELTKIKEKYSYKFFFSGLQAWMSSCPREM